MQEFLDQTFYGNTIQQWLMAFALVVGALLVGKIVYWLFKNILRRVTAKSKTRLDDIILDMIEEPIVVVVTVFGFWIAVNRLVLPQGIMDFLDKGKIVAIVLAMTWLFARLVDSLIKEYLVPLADKSETDLDDQLLPIFQKGAKLTIWAVGIVVACQNADYDIGAVLAGLGIGGLALAMAAKDTVSNIFGGFTIFTDRPFTLNDRVRIGSFDGSIREIGLRSTRLETLAGTMVSIPNAKFADSPVENVSAEPARKVVLDLGLTYDTTPEKMQDAMDYLREIAAANDSLEEKLVVGFNAFGDFAMNVKMIYYIKKGEDIMGAQTAINMAILTKFNQEGLEFAFPTQTIYTQAADS